MRKRKWYFYNKKRSHVFTLSTTLWPLTPQDLTVDFFFPATLHFIVFQHREFHVTLRTLRSCLGCKNGLHGLQITFLKCRLKRNKPRKSGNLRTTVEPLMVKDNNSDDNMQLSQRWVQTSCSDKTARYLLKKWTSSTSKHCIIKSGFFIYIIISQIETAQFFISLRTKTTRIRFETSNWLKLNYKYILDWWDNLINLTNKRFCLILCYGNLNTLF